MMTSEGQDQGKLFSYSEVYCLQTLTSAQAGGGGGGVIAKIARKKQLKN